MTTRSLLIIVGLALASCRTTPGGRTAELEPGSREDAHDYGRARRKTLEQGRHVVELIRNGQAEALFGAFSVEMARQVPLDAVQTTLANVKGVGAPLSDGALLRSWDERTFVAELAGSGQNLNVMATFDRNDAITALSLRPAPTLSPAPPSRAPVVVRLPVNGDWVVGWGGETATANYHVAAPDQRHALDLLVWRRGGSHRGAGASNEEYWAWGKEIVAPVAGTVVAARNDLNDNPPGRVAELPGDAIAGNHVVIDAGAGVFLFLAHMQAGSVVVKAGTRVKAGDKLGLCGNSGRTSEPHLHLHAQDSAVLGAGRGVPLVIEDAIVDGASQDRAALVQGNVVGPRRANE